MTAKAFLDDGYVQVSNELTVGLCEKFLALADALPEGGWTQVIRVGGVTDDYCLSPRDERIDSLHAEARREADEGLFSYSFARIADGASNDGFPEWVELKEMLVGESVIRLIAEHTGYSATNVELVYVNCFRYGDFLTVHTDKGGDSTIAAAFSLTPAWDPADGGCTYVLSKDRAKVVDTVHPQLGNLLLMNVCDAEVPHYVSEVTRKDVGDDFLRKSLIVRYS